MLCGNYKHLNPFLKGKEQSRRDDLLALGYMFYHFVSGGTLPWAGIKDENRAKRYDAVFQIKRNTDLALLGPGHPREFEIYTRYTKLHQKKNRRIIFKITVFKIIIYVSSPHFRYCQCLKFSQAPDYDYLKNLFRSCLTRHNLEEDGIFDWNPTSQTAKKPIEKTSNAVLLNSSDSENLQDNGNQISVVQFRYIIVIMTAKD